MILSPGRFQDAQALTRTPVVEGNRKTWTFSAWIKKQNRADAANYGAFFGAYNGSGDRDVIRWDINADRLNLQCGVSSTWYEIIATGYSRDQAGWQHILCYVDTTQDFVGSDRWRLYVNGELIPVSTKNSGYPAVNFESYINDTKYTVVGARSNNGFSRYR